jgi:hypothetical protein
MFFSRRNYGDPRKWTLWKEGGQWVLCSPGTNATGFALFTFDSFIEVLGAKFERGTFGIPRRKI